MRKRIMGAIKNTYNQKEAAEFLNISTERLVQLTREGAIRLCQDGVRKYYLGGELDSAKSGLLITKEQKAKQWER